MADLSEDQVIVNFNVESPNGLALPARSIAIKRSQPTITIGRSSENKAKGIVCGPCNGVFDSPVMSRDHARLAAKFDAKTLCIDDLDSTHGTYVNGVRTPRDETTELRSGDLVTLGLAVWRGKQLHLPANIRLTWAFPQSGSSPQATLQPSNVFAAPEDEETDSDLEITGVSPRAKKDGRTDLAIDLTSEIENDEMLESSPPTSVAEEDKFVRDSQEPEDEDITAVQDKTDANMPYDPVDNRPAAAPDEDEDEQLNEVLDDVLKRTVDVSDHAENFVEPSTRDLLEDMAAEDDSAVDGSFEEYSDDYMEDEELEDDHDDYDEVYYNDITDEDHYLEDNGYDSENEAVAADIVDRQARHYTAVTQLGVGLPTSPSLETSNQQSSYGLPGYGKIQSSVSPLYDPPLRRIESYDHLNSGYGFEILSGSAPSNENNHGFAPMPAQYVTNQPDDLSGWEGWPHPAPHVAQQYQQDIEQAAEGMHDAGRPATNRNYGGTPPPLSRKSEAARLTTLSETKRAGTPGHTERQRARNEALAARGKASADARAAEMQQVLDTGLPLPSAGVTADGATRLPKRKAEDMTDNAEVEPLDQLLTTAASPAAEMVELRKAVREKCSMRDAAAPTVVIDVQPRKKIKTTSRGPLLPAAVGVVAGGLAVLTGLILTAPTFA